MIHPLKRFSQNFLQNKRIAWEIVESLQITPEDTIIEIGPGTGVLSQFILERDFFKYFAFEIDSRFINVLQPIFNKSRKSYLIIGDIQNFSFANYFQKNKCRFKSVGNIPYNITSPIMFFLLDNFQYLKESVLMIQREVAERLLALPGTKEYGILSILMRTQSEIKLIRHVKAENFYPVPKVNSSVVKLIYRDKVEGINDINYFRKIVRQCFRTRRKTLKNNLARFLSSEIINKIDNVTLAKRPEELTINEFKILVNQIEKLQE